MMMFCPGKRSGAVDRKVVKPSGISVKGTIVSPSWNQVAGQPGTAVTAKPTPSSPACRRTSLRERLATFM